jgi:UDP-N-acetylglucosamine 2-epimerase (non-hydrolysing)
VTDRLADLLLTQSRTADRTLRAEGEPDDEIMFVGNVMVDALLYAVQRARTIGFRSQLGLSTAPITVTLHRPSNVDDAARLTAIVSALREVASTRPVVFPVHPRTRGQLQMGRFDMGAVRLIDPVSYLEMVDLVEGSHAVITDSGGLQVESTALGVPCLTVRDTTEWPETIECGANRLVPDPADLVEAVASITRLDDAPRPEGWDGMAAVRAVDCLRTH